MKIVLTILVILVCCITCLMARSVRPPSLAERVADAELIVLGTCTTVGDRTAISRSLDYYRDLQIDIQEVLWPPEHKSLKTITMPYRISERLPHDRWDYDHTPGVFILTARTPISYSTNDIPIHISFPPSTNATTNTTLRLDDYWHYRADITNLTLIRNLLKTAKEANKPQEDTSL